MFASIFFMSFSGITIISYIKSLLYKYYFNIFNDFYYLKKTYYYIVYIK